MWKAEAVVSFRYFFSDCLFLCIILSALFTDHSTRMLKLLQRDLVLGKVMAVEDVEEEVREAGMDLLQKEQLLVDRRSKNAEHKRVGGEIGGDLP